MLNNFVDNLKYIKIIIKHKWFVMYAGFFLKVPFWRFLIHDFSKFYPSELRNYVARFIRKETDPFILERLRSYAWDICWLKHIHRNPHHWQYWVSISDCPECILEPLPMPLWAVREMVAD